MNFLSCRFFLPLVILCFFLGPVPVHAKKVATQRPYIIKGKKYYPIPSSVGFTEKGVSSWYGKKFHGRLTSNGETYNMYAMTAAHKTLPMHTKLLVTNLDNGKRTVVRVNDRGPFIAGRIIDLSYKAGTQIGIHRKGIANVHIQAISDHAFKKDASGHYIYPNLRRGNYYVQIGAFSKKSNALKLEKRFIDRNHITKIGVRQTSKGTIYRVHIFAGYSLGKARKFEKDLQEAGYSGAFMFAL